MSDLERLNKKMDSLAKRYLTTKIPVYDGKKHPKKMVEIAELNKLTRQIRGSLVYDQ